MSDRKFFGKKNPAPVQEPQAEKFIGRRQARKISEREAAAEAARLEAEARAEAEAASETRKKRSAEDDNTSKTAGIIAGVKNAVLSVIEKICLIPALARELWNKVLKNRGKEAAESMPEEKKTFWAWLKRRSWFTKVMLAVDTCAVICFIVVYVPLTNFDDWFVTTSLNTMTHKYLAYTMYSENRISAVKLANSAEEPDVNSDASKIKFIEHGENEEYDSIYEEQILKKDPDNDSYKIVPLNEDKYKGWITVIYEPEKLNLEMAKAKNGDTIETFAKRTNAAIAINAGGAKRYDGYTLTPYSSIICNGKIVYTTKKDSKFIGMNGDGVLCLWNCKADEALERGMKWGVCFGPYLIVNGESTKFEGNGGYGVNPRSAIGQRADGIVLLVTIDGRGAGGSRGISMPDLQEIFERYGCVNAANLDGGGSTSLAVNGKVYNNPVGGGWEEGLRHIYNSIYLPRE